MQIVAPSSIPSGGTICGYLAVVLLAWLAGYARLEHHLAVSDAYQLRGTQVCVVHDSHVERQKYYYPLSK